MLSTKLSRLNWARVKLMLEDQLPTMHIAKDFPYIVELKQYNMDPDIIPALMQLIGTRFTPVRNDEGKYSFALTADMLAKTTVTWDGTSKTSEITLSELRGILMFMKISPRGQMTHLKQSGPAGAKICALVPLILASWKIHQGIGYMEWDWSEDYTMRRKLLDDETLALSEYFFKPEAYDLWSTEELLDFRDAACTVGTTGEKRAPEVVTSISKIHDATFKGLPKLLKHIILETWIAGPHMYHSNQIQNLVNLDAPRESRFSADVFDDSPTKPFAFKRSSTLPSAEPKDLF